MHPLKIKQDNPWQLQFCSELNLFRADWRGLGSFIIQKYVRY